MVDNRRDAKHRRGSVARRLNWLRAGVLGANDGVISTAGLVIGMAAATSDLGAIATAGVAGLVAGAVSMALGEYVSVSTQRDTETALIQKTRDQLKAHPTEENDSLTALLRERGVSDHTASLVAKEMGSQEALRVRMSLEFGIDASEIANPWMAAGSSALAFACGAVVPLVAILLPSPQLRIPTAFLAVLVGLAITGWISAYLGEAGKRVAVVRLMLGGALAMAVTFGVGQLLGTAVG